MVVVNIGDLLPDNYKNEFADRALNSIGTVLCIYVNETNPPKIKRFVIIGKTFNNEDIGLFFINSFNNLNVNRTKELFNLQYHIKESNNKDVIEHDSYVDCSKIKELKYKEVHNLISQNPDIVLGAINENDMKKIQELITFAITISPKDKKRYGYQL